MELDVSESLLYVKVTKTYNKDSSAFQPVLADKQSFAMFVPSSLFQLAAYSFN